MLRFGLSWGLQLVAGTFLLVHCPRKCLVQQSWLHRAAHDRVASGMDTPASVQIQPTRPSQAHTTTTVTRLEVHLNNHLAAHAVPPTPAHLTEDLHVICGPLHAGLAVSMGPGAPVCVAAGATSADGSSTGPDLLVQEGEQADGGQVLLFWVQCVHKGALVCRRNEIDASAAQPRCLIAVKVPAQSSKAGQLPPCTVTRGLR